MNASRMAERAAANPTITGTFGTVLPPDSARYVAPGPIRNRRAVKGTAAQRNSQGRISEWSRSPYAPKGGWR